MPQDSDRAERPGSPPAASQLGPGVTVNNRYVIERELGRGGMGVVYLARDERLHGMRVVIKFLLDTSAQSSWLAKKFLQEAEALTRINHPGVVKVIDCDRTEDGKPFFVMEFIDGKPLRSIMVPEGIPLEYAAALIQQIGQALGAAHREGMVHRDLKPENVMLESLFDGEQHVRLIDFGIAKLRDSQSGSSTHGVMVAGSLNYMSPEQFAGQPVTAAVDIYAFGVIAYELITGRRPFNPDAPSQIVAIQQMVAMQRSDQIIPPRRLRPSLTETAQAVLLRALTFETEKRPRDAKRFGDELARAMNDFTTELLPPPALSAVEAPPPSAGEGSVPSRPEGVSRATPAAVAAIAVAESSRPVQLAATPIPPPEKHRPGIRSVVAVVGTLIAMVAAAVLGFRSARGPLESAVPGATAAPVAPATPERSLEYSVTVRRNPSVYKDSKPFQLPGEIIFSPGDVVRFSISSPQIGFLYIVNESPARNGAPLFNVLFPSPSSNNGSARLEAGRPVLIPGRGEGFVLDAEEGVEKLWLVWSANDVDDLDALKRWANPRDKGEIKDAAAVRSFQEFLGRHATPAPEIRKNDETRVTTVSGRADTFVKLIKLEHHQ